MLKSVGGTVVCIKTTYNNFGTELFTQRKNYKITYLKERFFKGKITFIISIKPNKEYKSSIPMTIFTFDKIFISLTEYRKIKLKKLNNDCISE